ncbi:MAG: DNA-binding response regulator [Gammaproteobacteria bacterium]|nr:MAG: DNA-binding response regulator [Gammaproteobacteria bacterium]
MTWRALIADDEPLLRGHLAAQLRSQWPELEIVAEAANGDEALSLAREHRPDVAFLDIRMPGRSGIEVARALPDGIRVVFVTAYDQYAVAAFEQAAVDYLLKPVLPDRLAGSLQRLRSALESAAAARSLERAPDSLLEALRNQMTPSEASQALRFIKVQTGRELHLVPVAEVVCFRSDAKYTSVHTSEREYLTRTPLKELEEQLDPELFWRVHRSAIVSARHVRRARRDLRGRWRLTLEGYPDEVRVSDRYADRFRRM